ncbi:MAG: hypothetical protein KDJ15_02995 [Alphaproteobacteria bacterium]|nr:hypothetical protein [Alphaproteobacteria bacterium]
MSMDMYPGQSIEDALGECVDVKPASDTPGAPNFRLLRALTDSEIKMNGAPFSPRDNKSDAFNAASHALQAKPQTTPDIRTLPASRSPQAF